MSIGRIDLIPFDRDVFDLLIEWSPSSEFLLQWAGPGLVHPLTHAQLEDLLELGQLDLRNRSAKLMRILLAPRARGQGLGDALVRALVRVGFEELGLHRLDLNVFDFNESAIRSYERVGFAREGLLREARRHGASYWNVQVMGLLRHEWRED